MRVLVVLPDPVEVDVVRHRCKALVTEGHDLAVCYVVAPQSNLDVRLDAQRKITAALRQALDGSAEAVPVFVVSEGEGDGIDDCAAAWGATEVRV
jgi:hypothetical protein